MALRDNNIMFSREDTIKALAQVVKAEPVAPENIKDINELWISVETRFPNEEECARSGGSFLTCRSDGTVNIDKFLLEGNGYSPKGFYIKDSTEVIAWMNLPSPYGSIN